MWSKDLKGISNACIYKFLLHSIPSFHVQELFTDRSKDKSLQRSGNHYQLVLEHIGQALLSMQWFPAVYLLRLAPTPKKIVRIIHTIVLIQIPPTHGPWATRWKSSSVLNNTAQPLLPKPATQDLHQQVLYTPTYSKMLDIMSHNMLATAKVFPSARVLTAKMQRQE